VAVPAIGPVARLQLPDGVNTPVLLVANATVPVGVVGLDEISFTIAVQMLGTLVGTEPGEQATDVVGGGSIVTRRSKVPMLAP